MDAGEYDYAIAFQERIRIPDDKMKYYEDLAEMYVGDDVSPDFYGERVSHGTLHLEWDMEPLRRRRASLGSWVAV
jgi:hypothetical protein